jgi:Pyridoxamine 5'-phosphate oxidase
VNESAADLERLQALLDDSAERATPFLRSSFEIPERSLSAQRLVEVLAGALTVALATVTARGEPRVSPIGALFVRGRFHVPTVAQSARARHVARRPGASVTYFEGTSLAVIAHGTAAIVGTDDADFEELETLQVAAGSQSPREWSGDGVFLRLDAERLFTYGRT